MKSFFCKFLPAAALLLLAVGCVRVNYIGQTFDPIPEGTPVTYFEKRDQIPAGKYRIIGRGEISTSGKFDRYDIRELLIDEARKRGADAVVLVSQKRTRRGIYERDPLDAGYDTAPATKSGNVKADGGPLDIPLDNSTLSGEHHFRQEIDLRVLFLKDREELEQQFARRGRELDRLVKQPDPAQGSPEKKDSAPTP